MDRYKIFQNDPYLIRDSACLKNKKDITNINELEQAERRTTFENIRKVKKQNARYNLNTMKYIHRKLFSSLYEWAGEIRSVGISKKHTLFCMPESIEKEASKLFDALNNDFSVTGKFWSLEDAAEKLAYHYGELNVLHPFREGNGRTQRVLFEFIAQDIGYSIRWIDNSDQWIAASISAYTTDHEALYQIFLKMLEPAQAM